MLWLLDLKVVVVFEEGERKGLFQAREKISCDWVSGKFKKLWE